MGMDVWVNVFKKPFLCADSGPWRKMSRAWPAMSAITTSSGSTCPSHQESACGAAEARQERCIVEVVRKGIVGGRCWNICWTHLQMFSVSTVLGDKASEVEQPCGSSVQLPGRRPPPHWTGRRPLNEGIMFGQLSDLRFLFFFFFEECARVYGTGCASECLDNAILVRRFWTVEKPGELLKMLEYVLNTFTNVFCQYCPRRRPLTWSSPEEQVPSFLAVAHHHIGQEEDQ